MKVLRVQDLGLRFAFIGFRCVQALGFRFKVWGLRLFLLSAPFPVCLSIPKNPVG